MSKEKEYFSVKQLDRVAEDADYIVLYSTRSDGKSYATKSRALLDAFESIDENGVCQRQLAYMRRYDLDNRDAKITAYFADMPVQEITDGKYTHIVAYRKDIYFAHIDNGKIVRDVCIGRGFSIATAEHEKSLMYPKIFNIIFEEMTTMSGQYLYNEPTAFLHAVSSIIRDRLNCKVYIICNIISRFCPYFDEWGIPAEKIKAGEKVIILFDDEECETRTKLVFYHVKPTGDKSGMFNLGRAKDNITKGKYLTTLQRHLKRPPSNYRKIHTVVLEYEKFAYLMQFIYYTDYEFGNDYAWYISPKTSPVQKNTRVVTNNLAHGGRYVTDSFRGLTENEKRAFVYLFDSSKVFFSDNLTGTEFNNIINNFC